MKTQLPITQVVSLSLLVPHEYNPLLNRRLTCIVVVYANAGLIMDRSRVISGWANIGQKPQRQPLRKRPPSNTPCGYCFERWATGYDHLIPILGGGSDDDSNLYPSCCRCNSIAGALMFKTIEDKRNYVQQRLETKKAKEMQQPGLSNPVPTKQNRPKVLLDSLPRPYVGFEKSTNSDKKNLVKCKQQQCNRQFKPKNPQHRFCQPAHQKLYWSRFYSEARKLWPLMRDKTCRSCRRTFTPYKAGQRFCCPEHRIKFWQKARKIGQQTLRKEH